MVHKVTFNSQNDPAGQLLELASGHISDNEILFINEKIIVKIESRKGEILFCDEQDTILLSAKTELPRSGDEKFSQVQCTVLGDEIKLGFPEYTYVDNYPHCDGEYDRWTKTVSGYQFVCYNYKTNRIV